MEETEDESTEVKTTDGCGEEADRSSHSVGVKTFSLNTNKAGMEHLDTEHINRIIEEASKGSSYYKHQQHRQQEIDKKIEEFRKKLSSLTPLQVEHATREMDKLGAKLEANRDLSRTILHIDMDAFYAAVEMRDDPALKDKPMAVGSHSMLSTSNYAARRYGIRAAMPGFIGLKLYPDLVIVPLKFEKYRAVSKVVQNIFAQYDPHFSAMSLDEAYLDITAYLAKLGDDDVTAGCVVEEIRNKICQETQLTASAGIAPNAMLAKVCSDKNKPNGQFLISSDRDSVMKFVEDLPVRKICGIGNVTEQILNSLGVQTCKDLWEKRGILSLLFSSLSATGFMEIALGIGSTTFKSDEPRKSMSVERTFEKTSEVVQLKEWCQGLSENLAESLRDHNTWGKTVTLKLKTSSFAVKTRAMALPLPTNDVQVIASAAQKLLATEIRCALPQALELRLMGVKVSRFVNESDPSVTQRQQTLNLLLGKNASPAKQLPCPVCGSVLFSSVRELTAHIDACLGLCSSEDGENKVVEHSLPDDVEAAELQSKIINENSAATQTTINTLKNSADTDYLPSTSSEQKYTCPVCNKPKYFTSLDDFNSHVDVCLNSDAIKTILKSSDCNPPRKRQATEQRIGKKKLKTNTVTLHDFFFKS